MVVDGLFGFLVGVMAIALTDNWQWDGDLAVRAAVIDIKHGCERENEFEFA